MITNYIPLISKRGFRTQIRHAFEQEFSSLASARAVDAFIVATEDGFSPLGAARQCFASDLGISWEEIAERANWNRSTNERVTLVAFAPRKPGSFLRGVILAPCENSECYKRFAQPLYGQPSRDFYYNVTYEAIAHASRAWGARNLAISHLSACGNFHEDIATCNAEALAHFCDEAKVPAIDSFTFVGCCIEPRHLGGIKRLNPEGEITQHRPITVEIEVRDGVVLIHISWV